MLCCGVMVPIVAHLRDCIAVFDNELLLFSSTGPAPGW